MSRLRQLENDSIYIIREAYAKIGKLGMLWSMGKDSTVLLHLVRKAFLGRCPFPVIHIDTSYKIPTMIKWRDDFSMRHQLPLQVIRNEAALQGGMGPEHGRAICCGELKTKALLSAIEINSLGGLLLGIRGDEEGSRSKERIVSPRLPDGTWLHKDQPAEVWNYFNLHIPDVSFRIHPLLKWNEIDVWEYISQEQLEILPLYFSIAGKRYRSLGCAPCTGCIDSNAATVSAIIDELQASKLSERAGRAQDKETRYAMQDLRKKGYM